MSKKWQLSENQSRGVLLWSVGRVVPGDMKNDPDYDRMAFNRRAYVCCANLCLAYKSKLEAF